MTASETAPGSAAAKNAAEPPAGPKALIVSLAWDILLNATIPAACYFVAKRAFAASELDALVWATVFPVLMSLFGLARRRELDPVAILVLLGIITSIAAVLLGGDPRVLLVRESLFTGVFGVFCLVSLLFPRPIMFYFGRYFLAGPDPEKRRQFDDGWQRPRVRRAHRLITLVWGLVYAGEFSVRTAMAFTLPAPVVLVVSPLLLGAATIFTVVWTFRCAYKLRRQAAAREAAPAEIERPSRT